MDQPAPNVLPKKRKKIAKPSVASILLSASEAAAALGISRAHFLMLDKTGRIGPQPIKLGRRMLWIRAALESWAAAGCPIRRDWIEMEEQRREAGR